LAQKESYPRVDFRSAEGEYGEATQQTQDDQSDLSAVFKGEPNRERTNPFPLAGQRRPPFQMGGGN